MPRKRKTLTASEYQLVEEMASRGCSEVSIAKGIKMSPNTWNRIKKEDAKAAQALEAGRAVEHDALRSMLFEKAIQDKDVRAAEFLLRTRHGYKDQESPQETRIAIMQLPAPMSREAFMKTIDHDPLTIEDKSNE